MGSSLQEQFLKMGLVDKKKANKAKKQKHTQRKSGKKQDDVNNIAAMSKQGLAEKKKRDQQLNKKKIAVREAKEATAKARQLIDTHKITLEKGDAPYNFTDNNTIKKIYLSSKIIDNLVNGKIGIVKQAGEYQLVPADIIYKVRELNNKLVILLNAPSSKNKSDEDDPYADFQVPDDLMW
jgi:uncharacterized protein YaiL (DUF2058 family)